MKLETSFSSLVFSFIEEQSTAIQDALNGEKLIEFIKRLIEQLVSAVTTIVSLSLDFEPKSPQAMISLIIRLNDLTIVAQDFSKFKDDYVPKIG